MLTEGLQPVEILHIDTHGSRKFYDAADVNPSEKCDCQTLLLNMFSEVCQQAGGYVASNWAGDGGHAIFPAQRKSGSSVQAAREFITRLPVLAQQTATTLGARMSPDEARRRFRIKGTSKNRSVGTLLAMLGGVSWVRHGLAGAVSAVPAS